ncbi:MAG TPA: glucose 1-dehydrogenase [Bacillota bacterium]
MKKLDNKVSIITGGASGIGEAAVREFVNEGSKVVIADLNEEKGKALEKELTDAGADVLFIQSNVTNENEVKDLISKTVEKYGKLDVLYNNAGMLKTANSSHELDFSDWRQVMDVNLDGVFLMVKYGIQQMVNNGGGSIINTASIAGHVAATDEIAYNTSKHAVVGITRTLGVEYAKKNIRVNAVCPGYVSTPLLDDFSQEEKDHLASLHPMGRLARPEEIAKSVVFLASDDASFVTGSSLLVDGGFTAQ